MRVLVEEGIDAGLTWHLGNPVAEARAMERGEGVVALTNRDVVEIAGEDRLQLLQLITTQRFEGLAAGDPVAALILDAQGHIAHSFAGVDDGTRLLAWTEGGRGGALVEHLTRMRFAMRVEPAVREDLRLGWAGASTELPGVRVDCPFGGFWVFTDAEVEDTVGVWALEAARVAAGVPRIFVDTDERTIPNEIGLFATVLDKGCYPGQETVAKVHTLGRPPRRLVLLHLDGSQSSLPAAGAEVLRGEKPVGVVGTAALHHELGPIALALVKRAVPVDETLSVQGIAAAQEALVDPDVGLHVRPVLR